MKQFEDYKPYLDALAKQPKLAIMPINATASVMNRGSRTIKNWIRDGKIEGITIAGDQYVQASALQAKVSARDDDVNAVKAKLIEILNGGKRFVFYAEIMSKFGYDSNLSPDRKTFGWILGGVSDLSHKEMKKRLGEDNGGFLSSIVWLKGLNRVGEGYWELVDSWGYEEPSDDEAKAAFVEDQIDRCVEFYVE